MRWAGVGMWSESGGFRLWRTPDGESKHSDRHCPARRRSNLEDQLTLLGVTKNVFKLMRLFLFLFLTLHIFTCLYWRVKVDTAAETVEDFLAARNVHPEVRLSRLRLSAMHM